MKISRDNISDTSITEYPVKERLIKLDISKYLQLIDIEPVPPQIAFINAINNPEYRFITAVLSRRTGKSFIANVIGHLITLIPGCNILVIAPNYALSSISWDNQKKLLTAFGVEVQKSNAKDKIIELKNGSTIRMGSVGQVDSVIGRSYDLIIFDECAVNNDGADAFNVQLCPTLDKVNSKAIFISTPRGNNWFHEFYKRGFSNNFPTWASILSTYHDNPRTDLQAIEDAKASMSRAEFAQEHLCEFIALEGQIFNLNKTQIVDIDISTLEVLDVVAGLDLGFRDPTAFIVALTDGYNYYLVDEYLNNESGTSEYAKMIQDKISEHNIDFIYIDSAAQQTRYDLAYDYDITTINAKKSVNDGIGYLSSLVDHDRIFISSSCTNIIDMFDNYRWDPREGLLAERPLHDKYCHIADAVRYALYTHSHNLETIGS